MGLIEVIPNSLTSNSHFIEIFSIVHNLPNKFYAFGYYDFFIASKSNFELLLFKRTAQISG